MENLEEKTRKYEKELMEATNGFFGSYSGAVVMNFLVDNIVFLAKLGHYKVFKGQRYYQTQQEYEHSLVCYNALRRLRGEPIIEQKLIKK